MLKVVENRYSELVFNLDEIGYSEWESRKIKRVIVSTKTEESGVFHSIARSKAHISLLSCISASGDTLTPLLITKNSIPENFWNEGLRENENIIIRERNPPYMDSEIFHDYISNCFIPYVNSIRKTLQVEDEYAVLLMDSCQSHTSTETIQELTQNKIIVLTFPAHTTNLFQPCDLSLFGSMKRALSNIKADSKNEKVKLYLTKIIRAYEQVTTSFNIRSTFIKAGISYERTGLRFKLKINPENIIQNHGFKEIWNQNISIDEISARRRNQKFGVINEDGLNNEEAIYINTINQEQLDQIFRTLE